VAHNPAAPSAAEQILRWVCPAEGCGHDYSDDVDVIIAKGPGGPVVAFIHPLRCPSCRALTIGAPIVRIPGRQ